MNRILVSRTRALGGTAAAAVGAALLAVPGAAAAQTADCAALGADPIAADIAAALETAQACDVEVRISEYASAYRTLYGTPEGLLHLVDTAEAVQDEEGLGHLDPTLQPADDVLRQTASPWPFALSLSGGQTLVETSGGRLGWDGAVPVPAYAGATAEYDGLAAGLDLSVTAGESSAELRFTVADAAAWESLATGLSLTSEGYATADEAGLYLSTGRDYDLIEMSTPFAVRDATGAVRKAVLEMDGGGGITVRLPEGDVGAEAFPLTVSTDWVYYRSAVNVWAAYSSASPDLGFHRGHAGLGLAYFEAAGETGDALAGPYCDGLAAAECTAAEAASYWTFFSPEPRWTVDSYDGYGLRFPVVSASFRVDAAEGAACVAPELRHAEYGGWSDAGWSGLPDDAPAASGACDGGAAVYDVSGTVAGEWSDNGWHAPLTLAMTGGDATARFDGGSARLDVYFDVESRKVAPRCTGTAASPEFRGTSDVPYGNYTASFWRPDLLGTEVSWTATVTDARTGTVLLATEPAAVGNGVQRGTVLTGLDDGAYKVAYRFESGDGGFEQTSECHYRIDTAKPDVIEFAAIPGTNYIGETATVEVTVADEGFPDGVNALSLTFDSEDSDPATTVRLEDGTTAVFDVDFDTTRTWVRAEVVDRAGNRSGSDSTFLGGTYSRNDYDGDGFQDLFAVRETDGNLVFYKGNGDGTVRAGASRGAGWGGMDIVMAGDLTGDGRDDLLARDNSTGTLYVYPGNGAGGLNARQSVGGGWNTMGSFTSAGDFNEDGLVDLVAVSKGNGRLYLYPGEGEGDGGFGSRTVMGTGFLDNDTVTTFGDFNGDGHDDLLTRETYGQYYHLYGGDGSGGLLDLYPNGYADTGLPGDAEERIGQFTGAGDFNGDGVTDLLLVDEPTGELRLRSFATESPRHTVADSVVGTGWNAMRLPSAETDWTYDYSGDNRSDITAKGPGPEYDWPYVYHGNGAGGFLGGAGWVTDGNLDGFDLVETAGDLNGDGRSDYLVRKASTGALYVYPDWWREEDRIKLGTGWNAMSAIVSGQDYNADGRIDIIASEKSSGNLWLYPGKGGGAFGARVLIGTGWGGMSLVTAVGDLDHDGQDDLISRRNSDGCLYFYAGRGTGKLANGVKIGCGWDVMNAVASVGDFNGDGHVDWVARHSNGSLYLYAGNGKGSYSSSKVIGTGWGGMDLIV
ncbi:FG-GAP repeat domain-containing protein [Glycomyces artemisiae]|uniref:VCBS repeat protein n=1 Tax=Glycomyces artemisiae TaxID=1076443 RepID=A0A2T0UMU5_9ACTN|nr:VCBS repeat-containing protein [Glycomyces artemisiae]PRY59224.1 VCBS repeat protein [Glycomyces artemisiae]